MVRLYFGVICKISANGKVGSGEGGFLFVGRPTKEYSLIKIFSLAGQTLIAECLLDFFALLGNNAHQAVG